MLELVITSIIVLTLCLILHYYQHFRVQKCSTTTSTQPQCCYIFMSLDTELNLFPQCFIAYILFILCLCIIIIIKMNDNTLDYILDKTLIYGVLIICCTESFFSFYQYKIIMDASIYAKSKIFILYCFLFSLIYVIQIHFIYWLWPILILFHLIFNTLCALKFSSHLIAKYSNFNYDILSSIYLMKWILIFGSILQCIYLTILLIVYNINKTYYYLPLFWSISILLFTINFIKNRQFIKHNLFKIYQCCKHKNKLIQYIQEKNNQKVLNQQEFINYHHKQYQLSMDAQHRIDIAIQNERIANINAQKQLETVDRVGIEQKQNEQKQTRVRTNIETAEATGAVAVTVHIDENNEHMSQQESINNHQQLDTNHLTPPVNDSESSKPETKIDINEEEEKFHTNKKSLPLFQRSNTVGSTTKYFDEEKEIGRESVIYGYNKYKAMDLLGLTPQLSEISHSRSSFSLKKLKLNVVQSLSFRTSKSVSYIGMNEEEKLDICDTQTIYSNKLKLDNMNSRSINIAKLKKHISVPFLKKNSNSNKILNKNKKRQSSVPFLGTSNSSPINENKQDKINNKDENMKNNKVKIHIKRIKRQKTMPDILNEPNKKNVLHSLKKQKTSPNLIAGSIGLTPTCSNSITSKSKRMKSHGQVIHGYGHGHNHSKTKTVHFAEDKSDDDDDDDDDENINDGFIFYEEENEEEDIDFDIDDTLYNNEMYVDEQVINDINDEIKMDSYLNDNNNNNILDDGHVKSMNSLIGLGLIKHNSVSELKQLTLYQQQNSNIFE